MRRICSNNHDLEFLPVELIGCLALLLLLACLLILQEKYANEEVKEEESADENEDYEEG